MIKVAIMGYGTIGSGVYEVLKTNKQVIAADVGQDVEVKYILDLREFPGTEVEEKIIHDFSVIAEDEEIQIVVETMGGLNPAYSFVKTCLEAGKHVATSNKALVAAYGTELLEIARKKKVNFLFEASVGGGIPIIRPLYTCLMGEKIQEITGILNGTTNYILTKMDKEGASFNGALKEAQDLGYAERNPEADVEGHDTCRKIAILTAMATKKEVNYQDIHTEGITRITDIDFKYAGKMGTSIKLFGSSRMEGDQVFAWVAPVMIGTDHPLYAVSDVYNGILVKGNMLGTSMYYGSGAGKLPTASAVVADIMEAAKNPDVNIPLGWTGQKLEIAPMEVSSHRYFVRISGRYESQKEMVEQCLGACRIVTLEGLNEYAALTEKKSERQFKEELKKLEERLDSVYQGVLQTIRAEL
ncbi:MAG: homoserine dehydrogenase [Hungatella sp.]|nr:homoserine dehydrogenase [Hungatella sp.]